MSKSKKHKYVDLSTSKQQTFFLKLWKKLQTRGWTIEEELVDIGNDFLEFGDVPGHILASWKLLRSSNCQPVYLDFEAEFDFAAIIRGGMVKLFRDDFCSCSLRDHEGKEWALLKPWDALIYDILKALDEIESSAT